MRNLLHRLALLLFSLSLATTPALVQAADQHSCQKTPLKLGIFDFAPFYSFNADGQPQGLLLDKLTQLLEPLGCTWQAELYTANRLIEKLANGQIDIAMLIRHPMLEQRALYSEHPIDQMHLYSYQRSDTAGVNSINQLRNKEVIGLRGYGYGGLFNQLINPELAINLHIASDIEDGLTRLSQQKADHLLGYLGPTDRVAQQLNLADLKRSHIKTWSIYMVLSPRYEDQALMDSFNQTLKP